MATIAEALGRDADDTPLLSAQDEASLFWSLRRRIVANVLSQTLTQNRLRTALVVLLAGLLWTCLFMLFDAGFEFLRNTIQDLPTHAETVRTVYSVFFAALALMLVASTGIILFGNLYCSDEVRFLLTTPARSERIYLHKFQEAMLLSSWAFVLLGSPMLVAYGVVERAEAHYFLLLLPFLLAFVYIPGSVGAILCMIIVRRLPTNRREVLTIFGMIAAAIAVVVVWSMVGAGENDLLTPAWFQEMLGRLRFSENRLLPSWWLSSGLLEAAHSGLSSATEQHALTESLLFLALLTANALLLHQIALYVASRTFREGHSALAGEQVSSRRRRPSWIDELVMRVTAPFPYEMRLMLVKDLRLFRRDPMQWLQFLIFFGLLVLYFANTRRLSYDLHYAGWINMISFLNLAVVGLILSTFTTRFVYPMISLEGRRFWILGLLPIKREMILWGKFVFAVLASIVPCTLLILLSDIMLGVAPLVVGIQLVVCVLLATGLSGIAVGLGAKMPDLREESPSKIAAGFGGTLNLVISTAYIVAVVLLAAVPCHAFMLMRHSPANITWFAPGTVAYWLAAGITASVALGLVATIVPLWLGFRAFREMEL